MLRCYPQKPSLVNVRQRNHDVDALSRWRALPSVESLLQQDGFVRLAREFGRSELVSAIRDELDALRRSPDLDPSSEKLEARVHARLAARSAPSLVPLVNATGVVVHTNLGRAPLSEAALSAIVTAGRGYTNLEYDLDRGDRGHREGHTGRLLARLFPGTDALVVNNNAAAVLLALNTFALGHEVIVSRGELVEIGGSFRVPEILERSGARLREVGTTNKTRLSDYENALGPETGLLLRVHPSNFRIVGFTERATTEELARLARARGIPLVEDFGSGNLIRLEAAGLAEEPTVGESLDAGADVVTFSGDKLLGGPQAGILVGGPARIAECKKNPLSRALRVDKLTHAALEATLVAFVRDRAIEEIPVLRMLHTPVAAIEDRARRVVSELAGVRGLTLSIVPGTSKVGGGAAPEAEIETALIAVRADGHSAEAVERKLRSHRPPVIARISEDRVLLDLRTVHPSEDAIVAAALAGLGV